MKTFDSDQQKRTRMLAFLATSFGMSGGALRHFFTESLEPPRVIKFVHDHIATERLTRPDPTGAIERIAAKKIEEMWTEFETEFPPEQMN